jgi:acetoin utilization protein AcuC
VALVTGDHCAFLYNEGFLKYYFGENHPFQPYREKATLELLERLGIFGDKAVVHRTFPASLEDVRMVHSQEHIDFVRRRCEAGGGMLDRGDTPATESLFEGSLAAVGATMDGAEGIMNGRFLHAFNPAGGLHHARCECSSGFCVFNDIAVAVRALQRRFKKERIAIVDIDGHHGDGTQSVFYNEKVLTISLHHLSLGFFPGSGQVKEVGEGYGKGYAINVPLPFRTGDRTYLKAYNSVAMAALKEYRPDFIIHQFGVDAHFSDPLVGLGLTTHGYEEIAKVTHQAAHDLCDGHYLVVGGGGYNSTTVPRCWAIMFCTISGTYPKEPGAWEALHDKQGMPEPEEVEGEVEATISRLKAEVLPLIR